MKIISKTLLILLLLGNLPCVYAQTGVWANTFGLGTGKDEGKAVATDAAGNVYITGSFSGAAIFGSFTLYTAGQEDIFIVKYNSSGVVQWARRAGGTGFDISNKIVVSETSIYISGQFDNIANFNTPSVIGSNEITSAGDSDIFLAKFDIDGSFIWAKRAGGNSYDGGSGIAVSGTSIYLTGSFFDNANFNTPSATGVNQIVSTYNLNGFIAKYNENGDFLWAKRLGGIPLSISVNLNEIYLTGRFENTINFNNPSTSGTNELTSTGSSDIFIAKYDQNGLFIWGRRAGGTMTDFGNSISATENSIYITGSFENTINFNTPSASGTNELTSSFVGDIDIFIAKYDQNGNFIWAKRAGGPAFDTGSCISTIGNAIYITGSFISILNFNTPVSFGSNEIIAAGYHPDIFIAKYNENGDFLWAKRAGGSNTDTGSGVSSDGTNIYLTGSFEGTANFNTPANSGSNEKTSLGGKDVFIAKYNDSGDFQWSNSGGDEGGFAKGSATVSDETGNTYVTGTFKGYLFSENYQLNSDLGNDIFIAKYNIEGTLQWLKKAGSMSGNDAGYSITVEGSSIYVTGSFSGTANFNSTSISGNSEITSIGNTDIFIAKYNIDGIFEWVQRAGGIGEDIGKGITANGSEIYIVGSFSSSANFNTPSAIGLNEIVSAGATDIFIAKYNENGAFQWAKRAGGMGKDAGNGIDVNNNSIYLTGYFESINNFNTPYIASTNEIASAGATDIFIAKYDNNGAFQWAKRAGGTGDDVANGISVSNISIYLTGSFNATSNFNTPSVSGSNEIVSAGATDIFIAKYDNNGAFQWAKRAGGISSDAGFGIISNDLAIYLTGSFWGTANFNTPSTTGINEIISNSTSSDKDIFISKFDVSGLFQWAKKAGGGSSQWLGNRADDFGYGISFYGSNIQTTGQFYSSANFSFSDKNVWLRTPNLYSFFISSLFDGQIITSSLTPTSFCQGSNIPVAFNSTGNFEINNSFTAQLLKSGQVISTATGTSPILLPIPTNATVSFGFSSRYRVKVVASHPAIDGSDNGTDLLVKAASVGGSVVGGNSVIAGTNTTTLSLSSNVGTILKWQSSTNAGFSSPTDIANTTNSLTVNNLNATTYYRAVVQNSTCPIANSAVASITVTSPVITNNSITISPKGIYSKSPIDLAIDSTNISYGIDAFIANTKAKQNIAIGKNALKNQAFSNTNTAYTTGNIAIGYETLTTSNPTLATNGIKNIGVGSFALQKNTTGTENVGIGFGVLNFNTTGSNNTSIGVNSLSGQISGGSNTIFGFQAMKSNTLGTNNTSFGTETLSSNLIGSQNVSFGKESLFYTIGNDNTTIGFQAGYSTLGNRNILIGSEAGLSSNISDLLIIENSDSLNALIVGNFATDKIGINRSKADLDLRAETFQVEGDAYKSYGNGTWTIPSDRRLKTDISYLNSQTMLQQVMRLKGATYQWKDKSRGTTPMYGFIAQELQQVFPENIKTDKNDYLSATYGNMDAAFVESIKALEHRNQTLESTNEELRIRINKLKQQLGSIEKLLNTSSNQKTVLTDK